MKKDFDKLYKDNLDTIRRVCSCYLKDQEDVNDAVQDTFFKASQSLDSFNDNSAVGTWLTAIAKNVCSDKLLKRKKESKLYNSAKNGQQLWSDAYEDLSTPEAMLQSEQSAAAMTNKFIELKETTKKAMNLRFVDELSYKQIAEELGVPTGTVKSWIHRGRNQLMKTISPP